MQLFLDSFGAFLGVRNGMFWVKPKHGEGRLFPLREINAVFLTKGVSMTSDALLLAIRNAIPVLFIDERGQGACSGYGGVRFWIYQVGEDSTVFYPTDNHWAHPDSLSELELNNLSSRTTDEPMGRSPGRRGMSFGEIALGMMVCLTIAYIAKLWFDRGEFFH